MNRYKIFDLEGASGTFGIFDPLPEVEADTPKRAAEKFFGRQMQRSYERSADVLVESVGTWPRRTYLYNIAQGG